MTRDCKSKISKKDNSRSKKLDEMNKKRKKNSNNSDSDNSDSDESYNESDDESDIKSENMDVQEYRKFLSKIFPSKYIDKKIKDEDKLKKGNIKKKSNKKNDSETEEEAYADHEDWETASEEEEEEKVSKKSKIQKRKSKKIEESDEESQDKKTKHNNGKMNIIFTIGGLEEEDEWDSEEEYDSDYEDYEDSDDVTEDEDEEVSTDEDEDEEEEDDEEDVEDEEDDKKLSKKKKSKSKKNVIEDEKNVVKDENKDTNTEVLDQLKLLLSKNPNDKTIQKCIELYKEDTKKNKLRIEKKQKKQKAKNMRIFRKIVRDKNTMNDFSFYEKLELDHQKKIIKELRELNKIIRVEKPYRMTLLESDIPVEFKAAAFKKINSLRYMEPGSGEFYKIKNWVDTFMRIPFSKYEELPISITDGVEKCHEFMENAQKTLDQAVYGLNDAKMQIMQMLGQLITNPKAIGTAIAIHGPPGTGKTSLVKEGISKILNRPFAFIALGGATDSSFLEGHGYTYEGSTWGKIVQILIDSRCMNPVIYFDELDKISGTPRGEEIAGILTHLTDTSQNSQFHDKYFSEINFDLSKCLFIFSYNDESKVNSILKDRMYRIKTKGYNGKEKTLISNSYLLPKIREQVKFANDEIIISDEVISHIIETHCNKEDGVRNLKRCLEIIHTKLNLYRLMKPGTNLFEGEMALNVEFPFKVTKDIVDKLIKKDQENTSALWSMYL